jgi:hypothetical protein
MTFDPNQFPVLAQALEWLEKRPEALDALRQIASGAPSHAVPTGESSAIPASARPRPSSSHHRRKCIICNHPDRAAIEFDYVTWRNPSYIAKDYHLNDTRPIYRHADALGLHRRRARRLTDALARIIQQSSSVTATPGSIVSAARLYAQLEGSSVEPPRRVLVTHLHEFEPAVSALVLPSAPSDLQPRPGLATSGSKSRPPSRPPLRPAPQELESSLVSSAFSFTALRRPHPR